MVRFSIDEDYWAWPRPPGDVYCIYSDGLRYLFGCQSLFAKINLYFLEVE